MEQVASDFLFHSMCEGSHKPALDAERVRWNDSSRGEDSPWLANAYVGTFREIGDSGTAPYPASRNSRLTSDGGSLKRQPLPLAKEGELLYREEPGGAPASPSPKCASRSSASLYRASLEFLFPAEPLNAPHALARSTFVRVCTCTPTRRLDVMLDEAKGVEECRALLR